MHQIGSNDIHFDEYRQCSYKVLLHGYDGDPLITLGPNCNETYSCYLRLTVNVISIWILFILSSSQSSRAYFLMHLVIVIYWDITWLTVALINPGIVLIQPTQSGGICCRICQQENNRIILIKNKRKHCLNCNLCIEQYQHHCTITGNCIGKNNFLPHCFFILGMFLWGIDMAATAPFAYYL